MLRSIGRGMCSTARNGNTVVALVYGSFEKGYSSRDAADIFKRAPPGIVVREPQPGDAFDFDSLRDATHLVLCTSSQNGFPPANLVEFAHQLLLAADTGGDACLAHLQHCVWGNGDERWFKTFMNVPRYMDLLLEDCGSRRFYARGEADEPHAPTGADRCTLDGWAAGMWNALPPREDDRTSVAWDALWAYQPSPRHQDVREFYLEALVERYGELSGAPSVFARPDNGYWNMIESIRREKEARERERLERLKRLRAKRGQGPS